MNVPDHWPSTKALSVYNVLVVCNSNALPLTHVLRFLERKHLPSYDAEDVQQGVDFLVSKGLAKSDGTVISAAHIAGPGSPVRLRRANQDADLELAL